MLIFSVFISSFSLNIINVHADVENQYKLKSFTWNIKMQFLTDKNTDFREFDISEHIIEIITDKPYTIVYWEKGNKVDGTWIKSSLLDNSGEELGSIVFADDNLNISDVELLKQDLFEKHNTNFAPFFDDENFPFYRHEALHITHVASE